MNTKLLSITEKHNRPFIVASEKEYMKHSTGKVVRKNNASTDSSNVFLRIRVAIALFASSQRYLMLVCST